MDLVIQAPSIAQDVLGTIASLSDAQGIAVLDGGGQQAYRLARIRTHDGIAELCAAAGIDHAQVDADLSRDRVRVVAIDMDSTLITIECIDEIADMQGTKAEIAANEKYQQEMYGSEFFPGLNALQTDVFTKSLTGPLIKQYLEVLFIKPTPPEKKQLIRAKEQW